MTYNAGYDNQAYTEFLDLEDEFDDPRYFRPGGKRKRNNEEVDNRPNSKEMRRVRKIKLLNTTETEKVEVYE